MTNTEKAWLAGILDGEGSIIITKDSKAAEIKKTGRKLSPGYNLRVSVGMTHEATVRKIVELTGIGFFAKPRDPRPDRRPCYYWSCSGLEAFRLLEDIEQFSVTKQAQIQVAKKFSNRTRCKTGGGNHVPEETLLERESLYLEMKSLNMGKR